MNNDLPTSGNHKSLNEINRFDQDRRNHSVIAILQHLVVQTVPKAQRVQESHELRTAALASCCPWTATQFAELFTSATNPRRAAMSFARRFERNGLLRSALIDCQQVEIGNEPLCASTDVEHDIDRVAYSLEKRFAGASRPTRIFWPSRDYASRYGSWTGADRYPCPHKVSHDLIVTTVWLRFLRAAPEVALNQWMSERFLKWKAESFNERGPIPDAGFCDQEQFVAVEIGGNYPASWLRHHIERFELEGWAWQIW